MVTITSNGLKIVGCIKRETQDKAKSCKECKKTLCSWRCHEFINLRNRSYIWA